MGGGVAVYHPCPCIGARTCNMHQRHMSLCSSFSLAQSLGTIHTWQDKANERPQSAYRNKKSITHSMYLPTATASQCATVVNALQHRALIAAETPPPTSPHLTCCTDIVMGGLRAHHILHGAACGVRAGRRDVRCRARCNSDAWKTARAIVHYISYRVGC